MARVRRLQSNFSSGELDPAVVMRSDIDQYFDGAATMSNVLPLTQGGAARRPGMAYIATKAGAGGTGGRMAEFEFNDEQKYLFVFTNGRIDIYDDTDTLIQTTTTAPIDTITEAMLPDLNWTQSADTFLLYHPDLEPIQITRTGASTFTATLQSFSSLPVYPFSGVTVTSPAATLDPDATTGTVTLTAGSSVFTVADEDQFIKINDGLVFITDYVSGTQVKGFVRQELRDTSTAASGDWQLESGYEAVASASRGWFRAATFHEGRLWLAGIKSRPQTVLASVSGDFFNFDEGNLSDSDAINATIDSDEVNAINGIQSGRTLQLFTTGGEYSIPKSSLLEPITPKNVSFLRQTRHGSPNIRPVSVDGATLFYDGKDFREFIFNDVEQSYIAPSVNLLATHILSNVVDADLRRSTSASNANYVYAVNGDGTVSVLNTLRSQNVTAWVKWTTNGLFKDVCVVGDEVYFIVERTINGATVSYIEKIDETLRLDSAKKQTSGSPTTSWSNLAHLNGETVSAFGDDFVIPDAAISGGSTTTTKAHSSAEFGIEFLCSIKTMPFAGVFFGESIVSKRIRLVNAYLRVADTRNILVNGYRAPLIKINDAFATTPQLVDDFVKIDLGGYDRFGQVTITQDEPTEFKVYGLVLEVAL